MPKFLITCSWEMYGTFEVEANSLDEAIQIVEKPTPQNKYRKLLLDGEDDETSFLVHLDGCEEIK